MKIKDLIKHLETLDQEKELVVIATDPTDWEYGLVVNETTIELEEIYPCEDNGLEGEIEHEDECPIETECYVIRLSCQDYKVNNSIFKYKKNKNNIQKKTKRLCTD